MNSRIHRLGVTGLVLYAASACGQRAEDPAPIGGHAAGQGNTSHSPIAGANNDGGTSSSGGSPAAPVQIPMLPKAGTNGMGGNPGTPPSPACTAEFADTGLEPVYLAFAFDVSGSMGKGDEPYHDAELKWKPVVSATKSFFSDATSSNMSASLSFFPASDDKCEASSYAQPDVPMTALPSSAFATAIDAVTPQSQADWRGGTPTLAVLTGTAQFIQQKRAELGAGKFAMVLVSDGYPQGCDDDEDSIDAVAAQVAQVASHVPTYVIGVSNPPNGPDTVSNLNRIAEAGGTKQAFLIQTGDPEKTSRDFKAVIDSIRGSSRSCQAAIPKPPDGSTLDTSKVNVSYTSGGVLSQLAYDPACAEPNAWRYDDPLAPTRIELCAAICAQAQNAPDVQLNVEFGCQTRPAVPH